MARHAFSIPGEAGMWLFKDYLNNPVEFVIKVLVALPIKTDENRNGAWRLITLFYTISWVNRCRRQHFKSQARHPILYTKIFDGDRLRRATMDEEASMLIRLYRKDGQGPLRRRHQQVNISRIRSMVVGASVRIVTILEPEDRILHRSSSW